MKAEIISVGTELLLGHVVNSDAAHVARMLADLGIAITHMQVVGDNPARLEKALAQAAADADIIITTGGLGPTADDLTKEVCARFAGKSLVENGEVMASIREYFGQADISENQYKQALTPQDAIIFPNSQGTAPGCAIPFGNGQFIILLPGPPAELLPMLESGVRIFLQKISDCTIRSHMIRTFGVGEGQAAFMLGSLLDGENPTAAPYASKGEMFVKVTARANSASEADALSKPVIAAVSSILGDYIYGIDVNGLEEVVVKLLMEKGLTVATAESCTGGLLAKRITDCPGASAVFQLGLVAYANEAKEALLHVPRDILVKYGAVSSQTAQAMAENARKLAHADFGLGITGIAGPDGGSAEKPVGLVYIDLSWQDGHHLRIMRPRKKYPGRERVRQRAASHALDLLRRFLQGLPLDLEQAKR